MRALFSICLEAFPLNITVKYRKSIMFFLKLMLVGTLVGILLYISFLSYPDIVFYSRGNIVLGMVYLIILYILSNVYHAFRIGVLRLHEVLYSLCLSVLLTNAITYLQFSLLASRLLNPLPMGFATLFQMIVCTVGAYWLNKIYFKLNPARDMVVICSLRDQAAEEVVEKLRMRKERYRVRDVVSDAEALEEIVRRIGPYNSVMLCDITPDLRTKLIRHCFKRNKRVYITLGVEDVLINSAHSTQLFDTPALYFKSAGPTPEQLMLKRAMDLVLSGMALVVASPFMLLIALAIKLGDGGPVLYKQERFTIHNRRFLLYKFRSMVVDAEKHGVQLAQQKDDRITPVGRVLRFMRLDELPQLFNIFVGDMSIVGPRPERPEMAEKYNLPEFDLRTRMKAGLTGYAQVYGKYNTTPQDKLIMDLIYMEKYSLLLDLRLMVMTIKILFMPESTEGIAEKKDGDNGPTAS